MCVGFCSGLVGNLCEESGGVVSLGDAGECVSDCEVTECVLVIVFDLTASSDPESDIPYRLRFLGSFVVRRRPLSFSESGTYLHEQSKRARMSMQGPVKAGPEAV